MNIYIYTYMYTYANRKVLKMQKDMVYIKYRYVNISFKRNKLDNMIF